MAPTRGEGAGGVAESIFVGLEVLVVPVGVRSNPRDFHSRRKEEFNDTFPASNLNDVHFIIPWLSRSKLPSKDIHHITKHEENVRRPPQGFRFSEFTPSSRYCSHLFSLYCWLLIEDEAAIKKKVKVVLLSYEP